MSISGARRPNFSSARWRTARASGEHHPRMEHYRRNGCTEEQLIALAGRGDHYIRLVPDDSADVSAGGRRRHADDRRPALDDDRRARPLARARGVLVQGGGRADLRRSGAAEDHEQRQRVARSAARQPAAPLSRLARALPRHRGRRADPARARPALPRPAASAWPRCARITPPAWPTRWTPSPRRGAPPRSSPCCFAASSTATSSASRSARRWRTCTTWRRRAAPSAVMDAAGVYRFKKA